MQTFVRDLSPPDGTENERWEAFAVSALLPRSGPAPLCAVPAPRRRLSLADPAACRFCVWLRPQQLNKHRLPPAAPAASPQAKVKLSDIQLRLLHRAFKRFVKQASPSPTPLNRQPRLPACLIPPSVPALLPQCTSISQERQHLQHRLAEVQEAHAVAAADAAAGGLALCKHAEAQRWLEVRAPPAGGACREAGRGALAGRALLRTARDASQPNNSLRRQPRRRLLPPAPATNMRQALEIAQGLNFLGDREFDVSMALCLAWCTVSRAPALLVASGFCGLL